MPKGTGLRGRYAHQACDVCRLKKIKCDGLKPICGPCLASRRELECSWMKEPVRKPRTEAHFEALRKRADALEAYSRLLEERLAKCSCQSSVDDGHLQFRLEQMGRGQAHDEDSDGAVSEGADITQELCVSTENLTLEDRDLLFHGNTTPFRFATNRKQSVPVTRPDTISARPGSYVLLIDGVDETECDPTFDWRKYLPADLPFDRREHDRMLDIVFKFFTCWGMRVVPALFLRDMHRYITHQGPQKIKTAHYSPMLHNALLALGSAFSEDPSVRAISSRRSIAAHAKSFIEAEVMRPDISVVNGLATLASFHSGHGEVMLGYMYFGMGTRIAQALGLNIDASSWVRSGLITREDMVDRNWMYWSIFAQDVCWSTYVGRDLCAPTPPTPNHLRENTIAFEELDDIPWTYPHSERGKQLLPQPNHLAKTHAAVFDLLLIMAKIMGAVNNIERRATRQQVTDRVITDIDLQLYTWKSNLSPEVDLTASNRETATPHKLMAHLAYWWCFILLHRPFFHRTAKLVHGSDPEIDHVKASLSKRAAENIMELLKTYRTLYGLKYSSVPLAQLIFAAGTIFLLIAADATSTSRARVAQTALRSALSEAELCIQYLGEIGDAFNTSNLMHGILQNLLVERVRPLLERKQVTASAEGSRKQTPETFPLASTSLGMGHSSNLTPGASADASRPLSTFTSQSHSPSSGSQLNFSPRNIDSLFAFNYGSNGFDSMPLPDFLLGYEPPPPFGFGFGDMQLDAPLGPGVVFPGYRFPSSVPYVESPNRPPAFDLPGDSHANQGSLWQDFLQ
ncbi:fungal-specific transcription factor domain-containing protein [Mycena amicta]|nr:fungal-specific transcription factor domain-containing protein [Mycena amicta]